MLVYCIIGMLYNFIIPRIIINGKRMRALERPERGKGGWAAYSRVYLFFFFIARVEFWIQKVLRLCRFYSVNTFCQWKRSISWIVNSLDKNEIT